MMLLLSLSGIEEFCSSQDLPRDSIRVPFDTVDVIRAIPGGEATSRAFSMADLQTTPGSLGDPMRVLTLAGEVVSNSDFQSIPIISGDEADRILTLLDGFPIVYPYHLLGTLSLFNPLSTASIDLLAAGYPVAYGGYAPSAIQVNSKFEYSDRASIQTDLSLPVSSALVRVPLSDSLRCSAMIAARASHVGATAEFLSGNVRKRLESLMPNLKDFQATLSEMPSLNVYSMQECLLSQEHGSLESIDRAFDYSWQKGFAAAALMTSSSGMSTEHRFSWSNDQVSLSTSVPIDFLGNQQFGINSQFTTFRLQDQFHFAVLPTVNCTGGDEILYSIADTRLQTFSAWLNGRSPLHSEFADATLFSECQWILSENISTTLGLRGTYYGFVRQLGLDPRASFLLHFGDRTSIKLSLGQYHQSPSDFQILHGFLMFLAEPNQTPLMMLMSEYRTTLDLETHSLADLDASTTILETRTVAIGLRFNGYYKATQGLILPARYPSVFTPLDTMSFMPRQAFQAAKSGVSLSCMLSLVSLDLSMTASLSSNRSRIIDERTQESYSTIGDIPLGTRLLIQFTPPGWTASLLYQYATGVPTTDEYFLRSTNLLGNEIFLPIWRELNTSRVPGYSRLDGTVSKAWRGERWQIELICSVLNLLGNKNISNYRYEFSELGIDNAKKIPVMNTLPFFPNIGIRCDYSL